MKVKKKAKSVKPVKYPMPKVLEHPYPQMIAICPCGATVFHTAVCCPECARQRENKTTPKKPNSRPNHNNDKMRS